MSENSHFMHRHALSPNWLYNLIKIPIFLPEFRTRKQITNFWEYLLLNHVRITLEGIPWETIITWSENLFSINSKLSINKEEFWSTYQVFCHQDVSWFCNYIFVPHHRLDKCPQTSSNWPKIINLSSFYCRKNIFDVTNLKDVPTNFYLDIKLPDWLNSICAHTGIE